MTGLFQISERAFAKFTPTKRAGASPGPYVTAMASILGTEMFKTLFLIRLRSSGSRSRIELRIMNLELLTLFFPGSVFLLSNSKNPASRNAFNNTGTRFLWCSRFASAGTTPPNFLWRATCEETTEERTRKDLDIPKPFTSSTAMAVSSQLVSIASIFVIAIILCQFLLFFNKRGTLGACTLKAKKGGMSMKDMRFYDCRYFELSNGLRVVITPMRNILGVTASLMVRGGTRAETLETIGVSHAMEHMFFKGGKRYPNSLALARAIESSGGKHNALTGKETVSFYVQHGSFKRNLGLQALEDMIIYGKYTEEELEKEKTAIKSELRDDFDDVDKIFLRKRCKKLLFGEHPLGYFYKENEKTIARLTVGSLMHYREQFYKANNLVISVVGNVSIDATIKDIERRFGKLEQGSVPSWQEFLPEHVPQERALVFPRKKKKDATIVLASPACGYSDADYYAFDIFSSILGEGMGSRLFQRLRDKDGLGYSIDSYTDQYFETGFLLTMWKTDPANIERSVVAVLDEYRKFFETGVTDEELRNMKGYLIGKSGIELKCQELSIDYGNDVALLGKPRTINEYAKGIRAVKKEDILRIARTYLDKIKLKLGICAEEQYCGKEKFEELLSSAS